jgi:hypothetical protein
LQLSFSALVLAQVAHSIEEYRGRLWETFPPARFVTGLVSQDREQAFIAINAALIAFGVWCVLFPVRRGWPSAALVAWLWVGVEVINGIGHAMWSIVNGGYSPGVATAPVLLVAALVVAKELRQNRG